MKYLVFVLAAVALSCGNNSDSVTTYSRTIVAPPQIEYDMFYQLQAVGDTAFVLHAYGNIWNRDFVEYYGTLRPYVKLYTAEWTRGWNFYQNSYFGHLGYFTSGDVGGGFLVIDTLRIDGMRHHYTVSDTLSWDMYPNSVYVTGGIYYLADGSDSLTFIHEKPYEKPLERQQRPMERDE